MPADVLSDLLRTVRLTGAAFFDVSARAPWVAESPTPAMILPKVLPGADHMIAYHVVTEGRCFANIVGEPPIVVEAGEVVVLTNADAHVMASGPGMRTRPPTQEDVDGMTGGRLPFPMNIGDTGPVTERLVCGYLACDAGPFNPLLENLPPLIKVGGGNSGDGNWIAQFVQFAVSEAAQKRAGGESVLAKLSELMFIEVVRRYIEGLPPEKSGWLAGLREPSVGKALALLHGAPARNWTLEDIAREAGVSRTVLAERFTQFVGVPPMQYLAKWRMQIASERLSGGAANVAAIAGEIGYESEAAFSRAFKKMMGVPPSVWRDRAKHGEPRRV